MDSNTQPQDSNFSAIDPNYKKALMNKRLRLLLLGIGGIALLGIGMYLGTYVIKIGNPSDSAGGQASSSGTSAVAPPNPIALANPTVKNLEYLYTLEGKVKTITKNGDFYDITLENTSSDTLPTFTVTKETRTATARNFSFQKLDVATIKPGQTVSITAVYMVKTGKWLTTGVGTYNAASFSIDNQAPKQ